MKPFYERRRTLITLRAWATNATTLLYMGASWQQYGFASLGMGIGLICLVGAWICVELWHSNQTKMQDIEK